MKQKLSLAKAYTSKVVAEDRAKSAGTRKTSAITGRFIGKALRRRAVDDWEDVANA